MKQIVLQSNKNIINRAEELICDICDEFHIQNYLGIVSMAVMKAVENAAFHGNHFDSSKQVILNWGSCKGGLFFEVSDQGEGFDFTKYGEIPSIDHKGDGIFMMKTLADRVTFSDNGTKVRLEFVIEGIDTSAQIERCAVLQDFFKSATVHA